MFGFLKIRTRRPQKRAAALAAKGHLSTALDAWREAGESGDRDSCYEVGVAYLQGKGTLRFLPDAVFWFERAAEAGHLESQFHLAKILEAGDANHPSDAARWFEAASRVDAEAAERKRKLMFPNGVSVPRDPERARFWALKAAEQGKPEAQALVGRFHAQGFGGDRNYEEARHWYQRAAAGGIAQAELGLGAIFANGLGVERDDVAANDWYRKAAAQGEVSAAYALAVRILDGKSAASTPGEAVLLLTQAAEKDLPAAQHYLAVLHLGEREGLTRDVLQIENRLRSAAKRGHLPAMLSLAEFYSRGHGIAPNLNEAAKWVPASRRTR